MKRKIKERLKREMVKLLAATMVVGCLDGISFSSGVLPGSRVEAGEGEGVTTGNQITNQLPADYAIAYKVNETPSADNVPIGDSVIFIPNGYSAGDEVVNALLILALRIVIYTDIVLLLPIINQKLGRLRLKRQDRMSKKPADSVEKEKKS